MRSYAFVCLRDVACSCQLVVVLFRCINNIMCGRVLTLLVSYEFLADFGVSTKNSSMRDRNTSFIGTPYW